MAKTYIDNVKYLIYANVDVDGLVEKPDVVGAIFGQTEGLLGDELDLRDLQKNGRIGRIEVELKIFGNRTKGNVKVPSSLDMVETSIIAAAIETVDRVGPCESKIKVDKIEDTRKLRRDSVINRSKELLRILLHDEIPDSRELSELVRGEVKSGEIKKYGIEKLDGGPHIYKMDSIIVVEGRADVINLMKKDLSNVIAIGGAKVPKTLLNLSKEKEIVVFLDGDRGGDIILKELENAGMEIDFIARAPAGKEVEELGRKEIMKCLKNKIPYDQTAVKKEERKTYEIRSYDPRKREIRESVKEAVREPVKEVVRGPVKEAVRRRKKEEPVREVVKERKEEEKKEAPKNYKEKLLSQLEELGDSLKARAYDEELKILDVINVRELIKYLEKKNGIYSLVFDGIITQRLVDLAESKGIKVLVGEKLGNVGKKGTKKMEIITKA